MLTGLLAEGKQASDFIFKETDCMYTFCRSVFLIYLMVVLYLLMVVLYLIIKDYY
jgi:hypothetical protein